MQYCSRDTCLCQDGACDAPLNGQVTQFELHWGGDALEGTVNGRSIFLDPVLWPASSARCENSKIVQDNSAIGSSVGGDTRYRAFSAALVGGHGNLDDMRVDVGRL